MQAMEAAEKNAKELRRPAADEVHRNTYNIFVELNTSWI